MTRLSARFAQNFNSALRPAAIFTSASLFAGGLVGLMVWLSEPAAAQQLNLDFGTGGKATGRIVQIVMLVTVLSLAPTILVMTTSFIRIMVVLSFVRTAMGTQQTPPNQVLISLAMFITFFVMAPTFETAYDTGIKPLLSEDIDEFEAFKRVSEPFRVFMLKQVRGQDLSLFLELSGKPAAAVSSDDMPLRILIPAFMISELRRAFEIGFLIFVPFLVIDMVVASVLMAMGMMMLPPIIIALPFKVIFFVLVDGWFLVVGSLVRSFGS